ncbi:hypothetical protein PR048_000968 [Dryococelus australis]|uniref:Uncharacterized protein n=1 Tax=Dryococelus australis TaxID=614101 RepID=A0ABQ9IG46_9NEOP|nr:hypothetical protein PR048_000968 [Dryococelus australis]
MKSSLGLQGSLGYNTFVRLSGCFALNLVQWVSNCHGKQRVFLTAENKDVFQVLGYFRRRGKY